MTDDAKPAGTSWWSLFMAAPVLVYFLFPHLYLLPYVLMTRSQVPQSSVVWNLFLPVSFLADKFPPYLGLLLLESEWTGVW